MVVVFYVFQEIFSIFLQIKSFNRHQFIVHELLNVFESV
jgi:hypothetical protein